MRIRVTCITLTWLALLALPAGSAGAQVFDDCESGAQFGRKLSGAIIARGYISCEPTVDPLFLRVRVALGRWTGDAWTNVARGTATGSGGDGTPVDLAFREPCERGPWRLTVSTSARTSHDDPWSPVDGPFTYRLRIRSCG